MAYIYKITNVINDKSYIGKTQFTVDFRFRQHISDSKKESHKNRPLYRAINKYGVQNFKVVTLEETENSEEREIYWIKFYNTYGSTGYNATLGGDGKAYVNEELVVFYLKEVTTNCKEISRILNYSHKTILTIARKNNLFIKTKRGNPCSLPEEDILKIKSLYVPGRKGFGKRKIAKLLNLNLDSVDTIIRMISKEQCIVNSAVELSPV